MNLQQLYLIADSNAELHTNFSMNFMARPTACVYGHVSSSTHIPHCDLNILFCTTFSITFILTAM